MNAGSVAAILKERGMTLAVAESCTGGRLAAAFTAAAGASKYFLGGVVAYANEVKINVLEVECEAIEKHGAVSREVAGQMAAGVREIAGADCAIATTGIAGPGGGTSEKPVGTVWVATATAIKNADGKVSETVAALKMQFHGSRTEIMDQAVRAAIEALRDALA